MSYFCPCFFRCRDDGEPPECDDATNNNLANESNCGFMNTADGPFAECMTVNPGLFEDAFEDCMFDACAAYPDVEEQICNAMGSLYIDCQAEANVAEFNFRSENFCPPCKYDTCTVNHLYNDIPYNSKICYNVNLICTKISRLCLFSLPVPCYSLRKYTF